jgi:3-oxoacyl-[acyl-carrier-protein] synthase II
MSAVIQDAVAVTGCGVVSPAGPGLDRLAELLKSGTPGHSDLIAEDAGAFPPTPARIVPDLRLADYVGRKGTRRLDRMVGFSLVATHLALASAGRERAVDGGRRDRTGVAVGTSTGSVRSVWELARAALEPGFSYVPSRFPNSVMNSCAGQIAVWNSCKAVNATLASGHASTTSAMRFARNAIRWGQAQSVLVGGVEELCPQLAWAWHRSGTLEAGAVLGEGCAMFVTEDAATVGDRPVLAELLAAEVAYVAPPGATGGAERGSLADGLATCIGRALERSGARPDDVGVVSLGAGSQLGVRYAEEQGVRRALGGMPERIRVSDVVGDCFSAAGAMQAAAVLAHWSGADRPGPSLALVTSAGGDGNVGCFVLRRPAGAGTAA